MQKARQNHGQAARKLPGKKSGGIFEMKSVSQPVLLLLYALLFSICGAVSASTVTYSRDTPMQVKKKRSQDKNQFQLYLPVNKQRPGLLEQSEIGSLVVDDVDQELWEEAELTWKNMRQAASEIEKIWRKAEIWLNAIIFKDIGDWHAYTDKPLRTIDRQVSTSQYLTGFYKRLMLSDQQVMHFNQHFSGIGFLTLASKQSSLDLSNYAGNAQAGYYATQNKVTDKKYAEPDKKAIVKLLYLWKRHFSKLAIVFAMVIFWLLIKNSLRLMRPKY